MTVRHNVIRGNSDVGVALVRNGVDVTIERNEIFDVGADAPDGSTLDVGIGGKLVTISPLARKKTESARTTAGFAGAPRGPSLG